MSRAGTRRGLHADQDNIGCAAFMLSSYSILPLSQRIHPGHVSSSCTIGGERTQADSLEVFDARLASMEGM